MIRVRLALLVVAAVGPLSSCSLFVPEGDRGVTYTVTNRCETPIVVVLATGGREVQLNPGATDTIRTLDEQPDSLFVVRRDGSGSGVTFAPGKATFEVRDDHCPAA